MSRALIGCTGFVGGALQQAGAFDVRVHRANLHELAGRHFDAIVCAGLPAAKWIANRRPMEDLRNMQSLCAALDGVSADRFVLISTIDVYPVLQDADEDFDCGSRPNHAYGTHRLQFEAYVRRRFPRALIVRLPALFGAGLRKNALFDLLHDNGVELINPESVFQWYPVARLHQDIDRAQARGLSLVNLFTEPVATGELARRFFPGKPLRAQATPSVHYNLTTRHAEAFGGHGGYVMSATDVLGEISNFVRAAREAA